jgi:hypothetical protein
MQVERYAVHAEQSIHMSAPTLVKGEHEPPGS